jgi:hypothetical protein
VRVPLLLGLVAMAAGATGCALGESGVRARASNDLQCGAVDVQYEGNGRYTANGCGDSATYFTVGRYGQEIIGPVEQSRTEVVEAAPPPALRESPSAAAGFSFGATEEDTRRACVEAGYAYASTAAGRATCDGVAADVGGPARAAFAYCAGKLCSVSLDVGVAASDDLSRALVRWKTALADKYGDPTAAHEDIPGQCLRNVTPCLLDQSGSISFDWQWPSQERITLSTDVDRSAKPLLKIAYVASPAKAKAPAPGL